MVRVLENNKQEFDCNSFQFTVSMYMSLNVIIDDGYHGIRDADDVCQKWFSLGPSDDGLVVRTGDGDAISDTIYGSETSASSLIRNGVEHLVKHC